MRRLLPLLLLLAWPQAAVAGWKIDRARAIADRVWNHPCAGHVKLLWEQPPALTAGEPEMWTLVTDCTIRISARDPLPWEAFCDGLLHEYGHLAGYRDPTNTAEPWHSSRPGSVMAAFGINATGTFIINGRRERRVYGTDPRCRDHGRPYLRDVPRRHVQPGRNVFPHKRVRSHRRSDSRIR